MARSLGVARKRRKISAVLVASVLLLIERVDSFTPSVATRTPPPDLCSSWTLRATLIFDAKITAESEVVEEPLLNQFFPTERFRLHCLSAGGTSQLHDGTWDDELQKTFRQLYGNDTPLPELVLAVDTKIPFPGLQLCNRVTIASRLDEQNFTYEHYLIAEEKQVSGPAPLVYVYNKLVPPTPGRTAPSGTAYTKISKTSNTIVSDSTVSIRVDFSDWLIRILPVTLEKMEKQGSQAVQKAVGKDINKFISTLASAMAEWKAGQEQIA